MLKTERDTWRWVLCTELGHGREHVWHNARARSKVYRTKSSRVCSQIIIIVTLFGKAKCKLCGDSVRLALKHLKDKHPEIYEGEVKRMRMPQIMDKYFVV
jgi:hypothetical protein